MSTATTAEAVKITPQNAESAARLGRGQALVKLGAYLEEVNGEQYLVMPRAGRRPDAKPMTDILQTVCCDDALAGVSGEKPHLCKHYWAALVLKDVTIEVPEKMRDLANANYKVMVAGKGVWNNAPKNLRLAAGQARCQLTGQEWMEPEQFAAQAHVRFNITSARRRPQANPDPANLPF